MINVKQAVRAAADYLDMLYEEQPLADVRLEEVEKTSDRQNWLVTWSFSRTESPAGNAFQALAGPQTRRVYKVVEIEGDSGEPVAMRIRELVV